MNFVRHRHFIGQAEFFACCAEMRSRDASLTVSIEFFSSPALLKVLGAGNHMKAASRVP